jgi:hypothetical protein
VNTARAFFRGVEYGDGRWSGDGHDKPNQSGESKPAERGDFEPEGMTRTEVADDAEGEQKNSARNRGERDQADVDDAVHLLAPIAAAAGGKVTLIVATHLRRETRNVVTPARQDLADNGINTLLTHA